MVCQDGPSFGFALPAWSRLARRAGEYLVQSQVFRRCLQRVAKKGPRALEDELSNVREMLSEMNSQPVRQEVG